MPNNQSKQLAHGAMMIAMFSVLFLVTLYIPIVSILAVAFVPLPVVWYSIHYNNSASLLVVAGSIFIGTILGGITSFPVAIILSAIGFVIGTSIRTNKSKLQMLILTSLSVLVSISLLYAFMVLLFDINFIQKSLDMAEESYMQAIELNKDVKGMGLPVEQLNDAFKIVESMVPASIIITSVLIAFIYISISLPALKRIKVDVPKFSKFSAMRLPKAVLWYYLIILVISIFINPEVGTTLYTIVINFSLILWILLTLQGVSFLYFVIEENKYPKFLKVLVAVLAFPFYNFILLIGLIDLGFGIRKYISEKKTN
jgi:uncharacterized protein YybS (DUF2232 family)